MRHSIAGVTEASEDGDVRDAAIIVAAQKVEHYEIASYGSACTFANEMNRSKAAEALHVTLEEEQRAEQALNKLAKGTFVHAGINASANRS